MIAMLCRSMVRYVKILIRGVGRVISVQGTIRDMADFIKNIIPPDIPEVYTLKASIKHVSGEETIRKGVAAFRDLLCLICDRLIADGSKYDKPAKSIQSNDSHPSLPVAFHS